MSEANSPTRPIWAVHGVGASATLLGLERYDTSGSAKHDRGSESGPLEPRRHEAEARPVERGDRCIRPPSRLNPGNRGIPQASLNLGPSDLVCRSSSRMARELGVPGDSWLTMVCARPSAPQAISPIAWGVKSTWVRPFVLSTLGSYRHVVSTTVWLRFCCGCHK